jgi:hypothetical protein
MHVCSLYSIKYCTFWWFHLLVNPLSGYCTCQGNHTPTQIKMLSCCIEWSYPECQFIVFLLKILCNDYRSCIFHREWPFYERAVSDLERYMHRSLWVKVAQSSFIEGSHTTKNTASVLFCECDVFQFLFVNVKSIGDISIADADSSTIIRLPTFMPMVC